MSKNQIKFKPLRCGIESDQQANKSFIYIDFIFNSEVFRVFEELPTDHRFYLQKSNFEFVIMFFGGYKNLKKIIEKHTGTTIRKIELNKNINCDL